MNIVITTSIFPPDIGGPATYTYELLQRLSRRRHQVRVATLSQSARRPNVYVIQNKRLRFPGLLFTYLVSFIRLFRATRGCDLIYAQIPSFLGLASLLVARLRRKPIILRFVGDRAWEIAFNSQKTDKSLEDFLRSPDGGIQVKMMIQLQRFVLKGVNRIITPSRFLKEILVRYYGLNPEKIAVVFNSFNLEDGNMLLSEIPRVSGSPRIITIGRLIPHKRIDKLLRVVKGVVEDYPDVALHIVGSGPQEKDLRKLSEELGIAGRVKFWGQLSHQETMGVLRQADLFILNSVYEGFPHTVIEAMICRVPVVATNIRGTNEVVKDGETGLLVEMGNDTQLREKIVFLLKNKELRERLVEKAYQSAVEHFTWEKNLTLLERELEGLIKARQGK